MTPERAFATRRAFPGLFRGPWDNKTNRERDTGRRHFSASTHLLPYTKRTRVHSHDFVV